MNITRSITLKEGIEKERQAEAYCMKVSGVTEEKDHLLKYVEYLKRKMEEASAALDFSRAGKIRDKILDIQREHGINVVKF